MWSKSQKLWLFWWCDGSSNAPNLSDICFCLYTKKCCGYGALRVTTGNVQSLGRKSVNCRSKVNDHSITSWISDVSLPDRITGGRRSDLCVPWWDKILHKRSIMGWIESSATVSRSALTPTQWFNDAQRYKFLKFFFSKESDKRNKRNRSRLGTKLSECSALWIQYQFKNSGNTRK